MRQADENKKAPIISTELSLNAASLPNGRQGLNNCHLMGWIK